MNKSLFKYLIFVFAFLSLASTNRPGTDAEQNSLSLFNSTDTFRAKFLSPTLTGDIDITIQDAASTITTTAQTDKLDAIGAGANVTSVNTQTGVVVLDADDISDAATTNKFATSAELSAISTNTTNNTGTVAVHSDVDAAQATAIGNLSGTNSGDQTSIVGITGTKAQFDTALTDGDFVHSVSGTSGTVADGDIDHDLLGNYVLGQHRIINDSSDLTTELLSANKINSIIDGLISGITVKAPVDASDEGLGAITLSGLGASPMNGVTLVDGVTEVVITEQGGSITVADIDNGIYIVSTGAWTRRPDLDSDAELKNGVFTGIINTDSTHNRHRFVIVTDNDIDIGVTPFVWAEIEAPEFGTTSGTITEGNDARIPSQDENDALVGTDGTPSTANKYVTNSDTRLSGTVTTHSDVSAAGSGIIISAGERTAIGTNTTNNSGTVTVHSDVSSAGSGIIITAGERTAIGTNTSDNTGTVAVHSDVTAAQATAIGSLSGTNSGDVVIFTSTEQTITSAGSLTIAHGLGVIPDLVKIRLIVDNVAGALGYADDDIVIMSIANLSSSSTTNRGVSIVPDATNLNIRYGSGGSVFRLVHKTTGVSTNIVNGQWKVIFKAYNF